MNSDNGQVIKEAGPSTPVQVMGWKQTSHAGDVFIEAKSEVKNLGALCVCIYIYCVCPV